MPADPVIIALRAIRKFSHLLGRVALLGGHFLQRVESRASKLIDVRTGKSQEGGMRIEDYLHENFPQLAPIHPALPTVGQRPSVTVFAFLDPKGFYGGIATLLIVAGSLANKLGYDLRVAQTANHSKDHEVLRFLESNGIVISPERFSTLNLSRRRPDHFEYLPLHPDDVVVVSAWWDAAVAARLPLRRKFIYLVQDYEPIFYNNGDSLLFAESTYHSERFLPLCNTRMVYDFFSKRGYEYIRENAEHFEPAVKAKITAEAARNEEQSSPPSDPSGHLPQPVEESNRPREGGGVKRKMFLYGRTSVQRNLFFSGLQAIDRAFLDQRLDPGQWELFCAGQGGIPDIRLQSGLAMRVLGKMSLPDYYEFAQSVDVTVSPMLAPHPNYPTLELASLGSMVVSTVYENKRDLSGYSPNILMAEPTIEDMAEKIVIAASTPDRVRLANLAQNNIDGNWTESLSEPLEALIVKLGLSRAVSVDPAR